ncbi:MAG: hypothetical protein ACE5HF_04385 [Gemmatimonadota bacterium]
MVWALVILVVLLIPILAIVLDSQVGQALANRISGGALQEGEGAPPRELKELEAEVRYLSEAVESLREESEFIRSLLEGSGDRDVPELESGD